MEATVKFGKRSSWMRRFLYAISMLLAIGGFMEARTIIVEVRNIRGDKGAILVMAKAGEDNAPVYGMGKPEKGKAIVRLENVSWDKFDLSVFHDKNANGKLDLTEEKRPAEGYALESCEAKDEEVTFTVRLYYPENE